jgi:hypothetical protein
VLCCVHVPQSEPLLLAVAERTLLAALADMGLVRAVLCCAVSLLLLLSVCVAVCLCLRACLCARCF